MTKILKLNKKQIAQLQQNCKNYLQQQLKAQYNINVNITFTNQKDIATATTDDKVYPLDIQVGTKLLKEPIIFGRKQSDREIIRPILNAIHEAEHVKQVSRFRNSANTDPEDSYLAVNRITQSTGDHYYKWSDNYIVNPRDIRAEQRAYTNTFDFLCSQFPEIDPKDIEQILVDHINERIVEINPDTNMPYPYHVKGHFNSLEEINAAFEQAFKNSVTAKREFWYGNKRINEPIADLFRNDAVWKHFSDQFYIPKNHGYQQDKIMASLALHLNLDDINNYPCLETSGTDLSAEAVFGKPFPDEPARQQNGRTTSLDYLLENDTSDPDSYNFGI